MPTRSLATAVAVVALLYASAGPLAEGASAVRCPSAGARPHAVSLARLGLATRCLINNRRAANGRGRLVADERLRAAATRHARGMVEDKLFSHVGAGGSTLTSRVRRTGYLRGARSWALAENIGWGRRARGRPVAVVGRWIHSRGHRRNILGRFRHIGVGVARGSPAKGVRAGATYVVVFGRRR